MTQTALGPTDSTPTRPRWRGPTCLVVAVLGVLGLAWCWLWAALSNWPQTEPSSTPNWLYFLGVVSLSLGPACVAVLYRNRAWAVVTAVLLVLGAVLGASA